MADTTAAPGPLRHLPFVNERAHGHHTLARDSGTETRTAVPDDPTHLTLHRKANFTVDPASGARIRMDTVGSEVQQTLTLPGAPWKLTIGTGRVTLTSSLPWRTPDTPPDVEVALEDALTPWQVILDHTPDAPPHLHGCRDALGLRAALGAHYRERAARTLLHLPLRRRPDARTAHVVSDAWTNTTHPWPHARPDGVYLHLRDNWKVNIRPTSDPVSGAQLQTDITAHHVVQTLQLHDVRVEICGGHVALCRAPLHETRPIAGPWPLVSEAHPWWIAVAWRLQLDPAGLAAYTALLAAHGEDPASPLHVRTRLAALAPRPGHPDPSFRAAWPAHQETAWTTITPPPA